MDDSENSELDGLGDTRFADVPIEITISVGIARPLIRDLLSLEEDSVLSLDKSLEDPVELYVGDKLIGRGQLEEVDGEGSGKLGVRVVEITHPTGKN
ncbi:MAG: FliM/FliN family flagellar motor switch protein [Silicimonas sp.]|nr:FliM/FliN family flagellar motor switch protein [Silicimonas sp.]